MEMSVNIQKPSNIKEIDQQSHQDMYSGTCCTRAGTYSQGRAGGGGGLKHPSPLLWGPPCEMPKFEVSPFGSGGGLRHDFVNCSDLR